MAAQRKLRIELYDEAGNVADDNYRTSTIAGVEIELPAGMEIPGERIIEAARRAYIHMVGADFQEFVTREAGADGE